MRKLSDKDFEELENFQGSVVYHLLREYGQDRAKYLRGSIRESISSMADLVNREQAIGAEASVESFVDDFINHIKSHM